MKMKINGETRNVSHASEALLWILHDEIGLTGSHLGCGVGLCGSCSVLVDGVLTRSCQMIAADVADSAIVTIEGLGSPGADGTFVLHPVQQAFIENPLQCMWCLPGHIMATVELLAVSNNPTSAEIDESIDRNLCRCGGYPIIRAAVERAVELTKKALP
jgi:aerobic-type carbon monoxide dehydrogenase small subunit (CoxS/CutS family)